MAETPLADAARDLIENRAVMLTRMGEDGAIEVRDATMPAPHDDGIVIRVEAASVNPVDWKIRDGAAPFLDEDDLPAPIGRDCAGTIALLGPAAHNMLSIGQRVMAHVGGFDRGGQARFVRVDATEFTAIPDSVSTIDAGAVGLIGTTAWQGLFDHGRLEAGQSVLIHGGAGGVGHLAVQLARIKGATVYATCSGKDVAFVESLGAKMAIDYEAQDFEDVVSEMDLVFDLIGGAVQERSLAVIRDGGTLITTIAESDTVEAPPGIRVESYMARADNGVLAAILDHMKDATLRVEVGKTFPLDAAQDAYVHNREGHDRGKTVLLT
ncbi:NADP-dependent oxidoreductase [Croceicoccus sp. YJ47]|uniref:NADP-dependent oxidoreductase n=1 Tax=Croceicoccus sp. YJ47 TaxID=2798724 RepID=UPI0019234E5B|nr:NADP-dependent oxidoreductase [Croceicoccus sp. YJ47]QQN73718.1 NADP-dependent oxidoreductase [Croceicoccus sp. YJ47]